MIIKNQIIVWIKNHLNLGDNFRIYSFNKTKKKLNFTVQYQQYIDKKHFIDNINFLIDNFDIVDITQYTTLFDNIILKNGAVGITIQLKEEMPYYTTIELKFKSKKND